MGIVVMYTPSSDCVACRNTKMRFTSLGIDFTSVEADDEIVEALRGEGFAGFPVVKVDFGEDATWSWCGYRNEDILRLAHLVG